VDGINRQAVAYHASAARQSGLPAGESGKLIGA